MNSTDSTSTLVGSALERKINDVEEPKVPVDTTPRLLELRALMAKENLDYYVVPSEDAHGSEYVADTDKRREFISGFTGSAGQAIVSKTSAYLVTDSRYWLQAENELDRNWNLIRAPLPDQEQDWQSFLLKRVQEGHRIGLDARMISWSNASVLNSSVARLGAKLVFPSQNFVDLVWKNKPVRPKDPIFIQPRRFAGKDPRTKLAELRKWILEQPPAKPSYAKPGPPTDAQKHVATLVTDLANIAWLLNLRGRDIPFSPVFHAYLFVGLENTILFVELAKIKDDVRRHLEGLQVEIREYNDVWSHLRRAPWGAGKVLICDDTSYAISLLLTHFRYTIVPSPSFVDSMKAIKNPIEIGGMREAHIRDGASYVRWLAWLEDKLAKGYEITEYEAAQRLTEYRRKNEFYEGLSYDPISATGANAALPHYKPTKSGAKFIERDTPYLNDSGAHYRDGTIDCTRTVHFGRPTMDQCEAYTRVLQGHIAIDSAIFPAGTSGRQLDVLARNALWKEGLKYLHGTGHGFGSFLNVHEGPQSFNSETVLVPGHVITNEPGFYKDKEWGMRIESALLVQKIQTRHGKQGETWLGFERLTVVPIQTKMVREAMLSRDEINWIKDHNRRCLEILEPLIREDKRALKWLRREAERGIGQASPLLGSVHVDWD
ncbi:Creatinase/aminopeptidase [Fomitiporia mediterranea MF3/22]|uniref:Creatinase/aminopeptidase n=1 Tax=Fomitiporia mediterranea (strain MF3/22) TaxID=694068 RepID=UPI0004407E0F|nr:Creatinase/aminopeptidase [Fomitiporia mediterranea MF3/22]EJD02621.1 Creatinase/aminopeptidase [Fomitiporia mediterranea MF3/22]